MYLFFSVWSPSTIFHKAATVALMLTFLCLASPAIAPLAQSSSYKQGKWPVRHHGSCFPASPVPPPNAAQPPSSGCCSATKPGSRLMCLFSLSVMTTSENNSPSPICVSSPVCVYCLPHVKHRVSSMQANASVLFSAMLELHLCPQKALKKLLVAVKAESGRLHTS